MRKYVLGIVVLALALVAPSSAVAQGTGDVLNEAPLMPIPQDMTYEEYQDMNRRISTGLMRSAIPVPGMMHFYAGEPTTGKWLLATGLAGVAAIVAGAALGENEGDFPDTDFDVLALNAGKDNERRYEKIPISLEGETPQIPPARAPSRPRNRRTAGCVGSDYHRRQYDLRLLARHPSN